MGYEAQVILVRQYTSPYPPGYSEKKCPSSEVQFEFSCEFKSRVEAERFR
jgi:hypothetical protein